MNIRSVCVIDHGAFLPVAMRLARDCRVLYCTMNDRAFPTVKEIYGDGFDGIELIEDPFLVKKEVDAFIFPDIGFSGLQHELASQGFPVWGHMGGDELETMRGRFLSEFTATKLPMPPHVTVKGISALRDFLRTKKDLYLKVSRWRGDWETMHWRSWDEDHVELDARSVRFGPWGDAVTFYVFEPIDTKIEDGCDSYCIDGAWPKLAIHAMEAKDKALIATFQKVADMPKELRIVNEEFTATLHSYGYRGFFSTEVRITPDGDSYFIDPTCRAGSPPSQVQTEMIDNYAEVLTEGASGNLVEPKPAATFGIQALVKIKGDEDCGRFLKVPAELEQWIKPSLCSRIGDTLWFPPGTHEEVCWLTAVGDSIEVAIENLKDYADLLPEGASCEYWDLADLIEKIQQAEKEGMRFTDKIVPEPEIVLDSKT